MIIKNMFTKPIDRDLKGVIKVGQNDDQNVKQELEEYVVTRELQKHFADFFANYKKGIVSNTDKMGVWISGFFGSGKSHFLKMLSYILENRVVDGKSAMDYFIEDKKIKDEMVLADMKLATNTPTDVILFNIDSKSDMSDTRSSKESVTSVFLKVFNQHLGFYGANPHLADLERILTEEGKYEQFKEAFLQIRGKEWVDSRHQFRFIQDYICKALVKIDYMSMEAARNACESFTMPYNMDTVEFGKMVNKYIEKKGKNNHIVFLVDEIGQYVGENSQLMLGLQGITEELGIACNGKAWIVVTSQQDIDSITQTRKNDFSKIQGRFDTRLSLSSSNVDEVIRKRVLEKTESGEQTLSLLYDEKDTIIKNLIIFNDGIEKKLYSNRSNFSEVYPFIPYQFNLLGDVLTSIRIHGASGKHLAEGERSMLALFKESAMKIMTKEEGAFVPFNMFYDALEQFLDHSHKGVIIRAYDNEYINPDKLNDCFEVNVLKTLFMIKYVKEIEPNLENITTLMVSSIDDDRISLKDRVNDALKRLCDQTFVQKHGELYIFLTDEEQEINQEIKNVGIGYEDLQIKIGELIFDSLYAEKKYRYPLFNGRYNFWFNQIVDDKPHKAKNNYDISIKVFTPNYAGEQMDESTFMLMSNQRGEDKCIIIALPNDRAFIDEILIAMKIDRYLSSNASNINNRYQQIREAKRNEARDREQNAMIFAKEAMLEAAIYVDGNKLQSSSKDISTRINEALDRLVGKVFNKLYYIDSPMGEANIIEVLKSTNKVQISLEGQMQTPNRLALDDMLAFIGRNTERHVRCSLKSIMEEFTKAPYGFIEDDVEWLVAKLFKDGDLTFFVNNEVVTLFNKSADELYRYLSKKEFLEKLLIEKREKASDKQKKIVNNVMKELFNVTHVGEEDDVIVKSFKEYAHTLKNDLEKLEIHYKNEPSYPGKKVVRNGKILILDLYSIKYTDEFFKTVTDKQDDLLDFAEDYEPIKNFFKGEQVQIWDKSLKLMAIYDDSKTFILNKEIEELVAVIKGIMSKEKPYSDIRKIPGLLEQYKEIYNDMLTQFEEPVINAINEAKERVMQKLQGKECSQTLLSKVTQRFAELKEKADRCTNVAVLQNIKVEADALKVRLLNEIDEEEDKITAAKQPIEPAIVLKENGEAITPQPTPKVKTYKTISIKTINAQTTWTIETEEDVDRYVETLRKRLKQNVKEDMVLNVEF